MVNTFREQNINAVSLWRTAKLTRAHDSTMSTNTKRAGRAQDYRSGKSQLPSLGPHERDLANVRSTRYYNP